jgi:hypothetical protein
MRTYKEMEAKLHTISTLILDTGVSPLNSTLWLPISPENKKSTGQATSTFKVQYRHDV